MSFTINQELLKETKTADLELYRKRHTIRLGPSDDSMEYYIDLEKIGNESLEEIQTLAEKLGQRKTAMAAKALLQGRKGNEKIPVPNFKAFEGMLKSYLQKNLIRAWIFVKGQDGHLYPQVISNITFEKPTRNNETAHVLIRTYAYSYDANKARMTIKTYNHMFHPADVVRKNIENALNQKNIYVETPSLIEEYEKTINHHRENTQGGFGKQYVFSGLSTAQCRYGRREQEKYERRKVIHDLQDSDYTPTKSHIESILFEKIDDENEGSAEMPEHPVIHVFDLKTHENYWVNTLDMTLYVYDKSLQEKLVLPKTHKDLLDVLTDDLEAFTSDVIEGKSAGNVILCKGIPGVGKTLTAEVYSETIEKPLYSVHSGTLGTTAKNIQENLQTIFNQTKRWGCVLLIDEADVFVAKRRDNIEQNAIVAEFLRTLEYFTGLLFMTTNRPNDIDEAIISRCAAIIGYPEKQTEEDTRKIWSVMTTQNKVTLSRETLDKIIELFPSISPRDIKMLLRLALRVNKRKNPGKAPDAEVFRRCAMFRNIEIKQKC